jgi:hypothetical protein
MRNDRLLLPGIDLIFQYNIRDDMRITKMSSDLGRTFRHPSSEELLKLMENARRERSIAIAGFLGLGARQPKTEPHGAAVAPQPRATCVAVA